jgi:hypothetical protein
VRASGDDGGLPHSAVNLKQQLGQTLHQCLDFDSELHALVTQ